MKSRTNTDEARKGTASRRRMARTAPATPELTGDRLAVFESACVALEKVNKDIAAGTAIPAHVLIYARELARTYREWLRQPLKEAKTPPVYNPNLDRPLYEFIRRFTDWTPRAWVFKEFQASFPERSDWNPVKFFTVARQVIRIQDKHTSRTQGNIRLIRVAPEEQA